MESSFCFNCKHVVMQKFGLFCAYTNMTTTYDGSCDAFEVQEGLKLKMETNKKTKVDSKVSSIIFTVITVICLVIGLFTSVDFIYDKDYDAGAANYLMYAAFATIAWLGCKHVQIRKITFSAIALISTLFYLWAFYKDGFDELLLIIIGFVVMIGYGISYLKLYTKAFDDY